MRFIILAPFKSGFLVALTLLGGLSTLLLLTACTEEVTVTLTSVSQAALTTRSGLSINPTPGQSTLSSTSAVITTSSGQTTNLKLELAVTPQEQGTGLMGRTSLPEDSGMLFIFPTKVRTGFWMKDTLIPLSIAWLNEKGTILEIQDMEAQSEEVHTPAQDYIWALEVPKSYFNKKGIKPGSSLKLVTP
ncbi:MAG: DUF192 domain-containing protein [Chloroflexota bacterium]|nr:DUF192 domain-containing protein [Chloroflexota bacterium]